MDKNKNTVKSAYEGTQSMKNLDNAFKDEAGDYTKYTLFAQRARQEGQPNVAREFENIAQNELSHAEMWLGYMGKIGTTDENLRQAVEGERMASEVEYPKYSDMAQKEGFDELAEKFRLTGETEVRHKNTYSNILNASEKGDSYDEMREWTCMNCGYSYMANSPEERCPLCSYPKEYMYRNN